MVKRKLSFDVDEDKIAAIAAYVCNHVSSITFIGKNGRVGIKSATMDIGTVRLSPTDKTCWSGKRLRIYTLYNSKKSSNS